MQIFKKYKKSLGDEKEAEDDDELFRSFQKKLYKKLKKLSGSIKLLSGSDESTESVDAASLLESIKSKGEAPETSSVIVQLAAEQ